MPDAPNPWNEEKPFDYASSWTGSTHYARILNRRMTGDPDLDWFEHTCRLCLDGREVRSILLFSTDGGDFECVLRRRGYTGRIVVSDIGEKALGRVAARATAAGFNDIETRACDLNQYTFPDKFDLIIAIGILHHIERIDFCLDGLHRCLNPGGRLAAMEFTGAYKFQFPPHQVAWINAALASVPKRYRPCLPEAIDNPPTLQEQASVHYVIPTVESINALDPSEAACGHLLHDALMARFKPVEVKPAGGGIVMNIGGHFPFTSIDTDPACRQWFDIIVAIEDAVTTQGIVNSDLMYYLLEK